MQQALITMLTLQDRMNTKVHPQWVDQRFEWFRAIWIECGELVEHYGYKWWKKQSPDMEQVRLEVIDIWHFGLSALFGDGRTYEQIARGIVDSLEDYRQRPQGVREAAESVAAYALNQHGFSVRLFWDLMHAVELDFDELHRHYVGKNVLNLFRQDHGYKDGTYHKLWQGREDNEHLMELLKDLDSQAANYAEDLYACLAERYRTLTA